MTSTMPTRWRLNELMARHRVSGAALAKELGLSANAISALRNAETLPQIGGERLDQIADALTKLSKSKVKASVRSVDLLEWVEDDNA